MSNAALTTPDAPAAEAARGPAGLRLRPADALGLAAVAAALIGAYWWNLRALVLGWRHNDNYSHGFFIIPIAMAILWQRRGRFDRSWLEPRWGDPWRWAGWVALALILAARAWQFERGDAWLESATFPPAVVALTLAFGGRRLALWALPATAFLVFMLPLPARVNSVLASQLQSMATVASCAVLQALGLPVVAEGNVIHIGADRLEVARACNGLSMLMSFITLVTAATILIPRPLWERVALWATAVPIALFSNIVRIVGTGLAYDAFGAKVGEQYAHDWAGWLMMPLALLLVWLELKVLSWLVVDDEEERPAAVMQTLFPKSAPVTPQKP